MIKNSMTIKNIYVKEIKNKGDNYFFTINISMNDDETAKSLVYVELTHKMAKKIENEFKDKPINISGYAQAKKTKADVPFIFFKCQSIALGKEKVKEEVIEELDKQEDEIENEEVEYIIPENHWRLKLNEDDFVEIDTSEIFLKEKEHLEATAFLKTACNPENGVIAVRKEEDSKYSLVMGLREYLLVKVLNTTKVKAYITDLSYKEFKEKYF